MGRWLYAGLFFSLISIACQADILQLVGAPSVPIKRSNSGIWYSNSSSSIYLNITSAGLYRLTVEGTLFNPPAWSGRSLRVRIPNDDIAIWLGVSPLAEFHIVNLIVDGSSTGTSELINNLGHGEHPHAKLLYQGQATILADPGSAHVTVTYTLLPEP